MNRGRMEPAQKAKDIGPVLRAGKHRECTWHHGRPQFFRWGADFPLFSNREHCPEHDTDSKKVVFAALVGIVEKAISANGKGAAWLLPAGKHCSCRIGSSGCA